ncbi:hypothetical protein J4450_04570 [Candidatus Micrarchaeota archaeon]|nr:hypothetical protein [Candidatus Micrarchaeota archaeon]
MQLYRAREATDKYLRDVGVKNSFSSVKFVQRVGQTDRFMQPPEKRMN